MERVRGCFRNIMLISRTSSGISQQGCILLQCSVSVDFTMRNRSPIKYRYEDMYILHQKGIILYIEIQHVHDIGLMLLLLSLPLWMVQWMLRKLRCAKKIRSDRLDSLSFFIAGFSLTIGVSVEQLDITVGAPANYKNNTKGLMGVFNDDATDDLLPPGENAVPLSNSSSEKTIFKEFGELCTWADRTLPYLMCPSFTNNNCYTVTNITRLNVYTAVCISFAL